MARDIYMFIHAGRYVMGAVLEGSELNFAGNKSTTIYGDTYKAKLRERFMEAMANGSDLSVDDDGNLIVVETKLVFQRLFWNHETNSFEKSYMNYVKSRGRNAKKLSKVNNHTSENAYSEGSLEEKV